MNSVNNFEYTIRETDDYELVSLLMKSSGLGVEISTHHHEGIEKMWRMDDKDGNLVGAVVFHFRGGVYTLGGLAVNDYYRGHNCGEILLNTLYEEAKSRGITELWTCAKIPNYYSRLGWNVTPWETSPKVATNCPGCHKYGVSCFPVIMKINLTDTKISSANRQSIMDMISRNAYHQHQLSQIAGRVTSDAEKHKAINRIIDEIDSINEKLSNLIDE